MLNIGIITWAQNLTKFTCSIFIQVFQGIPKKDHSLFIVYPTFRAREVVEHKLYLGKILIFEVYFVVLKLQFVCKTNLYILSGNYTLILLVSTYLYYLIPEKIQFKYILYVDVYLFHRYVPRLFIQR